MDGGNSSQELHRSILTPCRHARCRVNFAHASRLAPVICNSRAFFQQERTLAPDPQFYAGTLVRARLVPNSNHQSHDVTGYSKLFERRSDERRDASHSFTQFQCATHQRDAK